MPRGLEIKTLLRAILTGAALTSQADQVDASATKLNEANRSMRVNPIVQDIEMSPEQLTDAGFASQGLSLGKVNESAEHIVHMTTPPGEPIGDTQVSTEGERKPALATAVPGETANNDLEQVGGGTAELPPVIEAYYMRPAPEVVVLPGSNIRAEPATQIVENGSTRDVEIVITTSGDPNEVFALNGDPVLQPDGLWLPIRRGTLDEEGVFVPQTAAGTGWVREDRTDTAQYSRRAISISEAFSPEQRTLIQQQAVQVAAERGFVLSIITQYEANEPGYESVFNKLVAVNDAGNIVMVYQANMAGEGGWFTLAPMPFPGGAEQAVFLVDNAELLTNDDAAAIAEAAMAPYERLISTMPEGSERIYMEPSGDLHYIWALGPDGLQLGLWNMTPDGGEWAELLIDTPNRETMANPEVFDQIPEHIKQSYLYSEALGGYFRVQRQRDGQNAIEVYMPRLVGFYDVSTNTTSEGWARLFDSFYDEQQGNINAFGVGDFTNRTRPADFGGFTEGDDERVETVLRGGYRRAVELMHEVSDGFNTPLTPEEVQQALESGEESIKLRLPNDWAFWLENNHEDLENLVARNPNMIHDRTIKYSSGMNIVFLAQMTDSTRLQSARWLSPDIYSSSSRELSIGSGYAANENAMLSLLIFHSSAGGPDYIQHGVDLYLAQSLARLVEHSRTNPSAMRQSLDIATPRIQWQISEQMQLGSSLADANRVIPEGRFHPTIDVTPNA